MGNEQLDDLTTRTANLKRQLLEKMHQRGSTPQPRTTSDTPRPATSSDIKAAHPISRPPSAPIEKNSTVPPPAPASAAPAAAKTASKTVPATANPSSVAPAAPPLAPASASSPAPAQLRLNASENDLQEFISGISSSIAANQESISRAQTQSSASTAATTGPPAEYRSASSVSQAPKTQQALQQTQTPSQAARFEIPGLTTGLANGTPMISALEQARTAAHAPQAAPKQQAVSGSWLEFLQDATLPPSERNPVVRENGTPAMANRPSGMSTGQPPSAAQNGFHIGSYAVTTPQATTAAPAAMPPSRETGSPVSAVRLTHEELRDLSEWLVHTNFYDAAYRQSFLSRRRRLAALEEERLRLLQEVEEESSRYGRLSYPTGGYMAPGSQANSPAMGPPMHGGRISPAGVPVPPAPSMSMISKSPMGAVPDSFNATLGMSQQGDSFDQRQSVKRARPEIENSFAPGDSRDAQRDVPRDVQDRPNKVPRTDDGPTLWGSTWRSPQAQAKTVAPPPTAATATKSHEEPTPPARGIVSAGYSRVINGDTNKPASFGSKSDGPPVASGISGASGASGASGSGASKALGASASTSASSSAAPPSGLRDRDGAKSPMPPLSPLNAPRHRHASPGRIKNEDDDTSYGPSSWKVPRHNSFSSTNHHYGPHPPIDLGHKGDSKFFLIKPLNDKYVDEAMRDNVWSTSQSNGDILRNKFRAKRNVILFFSVNKSRAFQGYARMTCEPSSSIERPEWMTRTKWMASPPFRIQWLNKATMSNHFAHSNKNSYNDNMPVTVGLDGQEIEESSGRALIQSMEVNKYKQGQKEQKEREKDRALDRALDRSPDRGPERDQEREPKGKFETGPSYASKGPSSAKKTRPPDRTWSKPHHSSMSDHGYNRPYSPDRR